MKETIRYIYSLDKGLINEHKFMQEMDLDNLPKQGSPIKTFYDETVLFENISGIVDAETKKITFIQNNKLVSFNQSELNEKIKSLASDFYNQAKAANSEDLMGKRNPAHYPESHLEILFESLKKVNIQVKEENVDFNLDEYKKIQNDIMLYSNQSSLLELKKSPYNFMIRMIRGVNTILAMNDKMEVNYSSKMFNTYCNDETDEEHLDYSDASSTLNDLYFATNYYAFEHKDTAKPKFKM